MPQNSSVKFHLHLKTSRALRFGSNAFPPTPPHQWLNRNDKTRARRLSGCAQIRDIRGGINFNIIILISSYAKCSQPFGHISILWQLLGSCVYFYIENWSTFLSVQHKKQHCSIQCSCSSCCLKMDPWQMHVLS